LTRFKKVTLPYFFVARYHPNTEMHALALQSGADPTLLREHARRIFHDVTLPTPTFTVQQLEHFRFRYKCEVLFDKERLERSQAILERHLSPADILDFYSNLTGHPITDVENEIMSLGRDNSRRQPTSPVSRSRAPDRRAPARTCSPGRGRPRGRTSRDGS
jgi:hypothetical protein